jgi:hypothetical protein
MLIRITSLVDRGPVLRSRSRNAMRLRLRLQTLCSTLVDYYKCPKLEQFFTFPVHIYYYFKHTKIRGTKKGTIFNIIFL